MNAELLRLCTQDLPKYGQTPSPTTRKRNFLTFLHHQQPAFSLLGDDDRNVQNVVIYKAKSKEQGKDLTYSLHNWFEQDSVYKDDTKPLQWELGEKRLIEFADPESKVNCMYWAQKKYQSRLCVSSDTVLQL